MKWRILHFLEIRGTLKKNEISLVRLGGKMDKLVISQLEIDLLDGARGNTDELLTSE
jgi:hypothetical protein